MKVALFCEKELPPVKHVSTGVSLEGYFIIFLAFFVLNLKVSLGFKALTSSATIAVN